LIILLEIAKRYWGHIGVALAVLFAALTMRGCARQVDLESKLQACLAKPPSIQYQTVTVTAKATQSVRIVYKDGSPCPDVLAVNDAETGASVAQGQENGSTGQPGAKSGLFLGASYGSSGPLATASVTLGPVMVHGGGWVGAWQAGAAYRILAW
jgi:hypothetical protein